MRKEDPTFAAYTQFRHFVPRMNDFADAEARVSGYTSHHIQSLSRQRCRLCFRNWSTTAETNCPHRATLPERLPALLFHLVWPKVKPSLWLLLKRRWHELEVPWGRRFPSFVDSSARQATLVSCFECGFSCRTCLHSFVHSQPLLHSSAHCQAPEDSLQPFSVCELYS